MKILVTETFKKLLEKEIVFHPQEPETSEIEVSEGELYKYIRMYETYFKLIKLLDLPGHE